ncbi:MAG: VOC family protein [Marmoricola sp.]
MTDAKVGLVLDCTDPEALAAFWGPALGYANVGTFGVFVALLPDGRPGPKLLLQKVGEPKPGKNRMHLDLHADDVLVEVERLVGLGASRLDDEPQTEFGTSWIRMADPEGNEFCVCSG